MKFTLAKLWEEYFADECSLIDTDEERALTKKSVELHEIANKSLTKKQICAVENYIDSLCEIQSCFVKKAFLKGCEFSTSFVFETLIGSNTKHH